MRTSVSSNASISSADALWALISKQAKSTRRLLTEKLLASDIVTAEQLLLKTSIERGWKQVQSMKQKGQKAPSLQDLIEDLRQDCHADGVGRGETGHLYFEL